MKVCDNSAKSICKAKQFPDSKDWYKIEGQIKWDERWDAKSQIKKPKEETKPWDYKKIAIWSSIGAVGAYAIMPKDEYG